MKIQIALKENGKVSRPKWHTSQYVCEKHHRFYVCAEFNEDIEYSSVDLLDDNWQPFSEVKEIIPEKVGELWKLEASEYFIVRV